MRDEKLESFNIIKVVICFVVTMEIHYYQHFLTGLTDYSTHLWAPYRDYVLEHANPIGELIFMLSGVFFAVAYRNKAIAGKTTFVDFMAKRFIRIWPMVVFALIYLYFIQVGVHSVTGYCFSWTGTTNIWTYLGDIFFVRCFLMGTTELGPMPINGSTWQLYILMGCYAVAIILCFIEGYIQRESEKRGKKWNTIWIYLIPITIGTILYVVKLYIPCLTQNWGRGYSFFLGIYAYEIMKKCQGLEDKKRYIVLAISGAMYLAVMLAGNKMWDMWGLNESLVYTYIGSMALLVFFYNCHVAVKVGQWKPIAFLSDLTFDLFTWNFPVMGTFYLLIKAGIITFSGHEIIVWTVMWVAHIIVASISHVLIEKKFGSWLTGKWVNFYKNRTAR